MMSPDFMPSAMPPIDECGEEELWSGDSEDEQKVRSTLSKKECDEIDSTGVGNEAPENCEDIVEEPKEGMTFDTSDEAYLHYSRYGKEKGFAVATRTSRKGKDGMLRNLIIACSRGGKARVTTSNRVKPRPQSKIGCPAHVTVVLHLDGKWRLTRVDLEHNHDITPGKVRYFRCNRALDEYVKRRLELNDEAGISVRKTYDSLKIEAGGPVITSTLKRVCRRHRWPPRMGKKHINQSGPYESPLAVDQEEIPQQRSDTSMPSNTNSVLVKARYVNNITIKFQLSRPWVLEELEQQVKKRLKLEAGAYYIKYVDEDNDSILIACDEDLQYYISSSRPRGTTSIEVLLEPK